VKSTRYDALLLLSCTCSCSPIALAFHPPVTAPGVKTNEAISWPLTSFRELCLHGALCGTTSRHVTPKEFSVKQQVVRPPPPSQSYLFSHESAATLSGPLHFVRSLPVPLCIVFYTLWRPSVCQNKLELKGRRKSSEIKERKEPACRMSSWRGLTAGPGLPLRHRDVAWQQVQACPSDIVTWPDSRSRPAPQTS
jgi:hypothetical protein